MFIRWERRLLARPTPIAPENYSLYAQVVESRRINGKPRQKILKYIGSIKEDCVTNAKDQKNFWEQANKQLDDLKLEPEQRQRLVESLRKKVAYPE